MFDKLKNRIMGKKTKRGFKALAEEEGVELRDLTREELTMLNFGHFTRRLIEAGCLPSDYALVYNLTEIVPNGKDSDSINYINLTYRSFTKPKDIKVNIKSLNVTTAKGDSNVYQYNKGMTEVWVDMCYAVLWAKDFATKRPKEVVDERSM